MKAADIRVGDRIDGWMVIGAHRAQSYCGDGDLVGSVLLTLEIEAHLCRYMDKCGNEIEEEVPTETRRVWYRADEDVEVER